MFIANLKNLAKKTLRQPLFYLLPLLAVLYLLAIPAEVEISDVKIKRNDETKDIGLNYSVEMPKDEIFFVSFDLTVKNTKSVKVNIVPDDCIKEILINEEKFSLDGIKGLCDYSNGAYFDFSKYALEGLNKFEIRLKNTGGPGGIRIEMPHNGFENLSLIHFIFASLSLISFILGAIIFRNNDTVLKIVALSFGMILFWFIASVNGGIIPPEVPTLMTAIFLGASCIFLSNKKVSFTAFIFIMIMLAALMLIRGGLLYYTSADYNGFLAHWVKQMRELSLAGAISAKIGDYNMPYLYVLALISRFEINDLFPIKLFSVIFDIAIAYYAMKIVSMKFENINAQIAAFLAVMSIPTVIFNGAFWAQCDVVYSALAIASLYCAFTGKSIHSFVFFGLAISFKLQAIFIMPMLIVFLFLKKIKIMHIWIPIATFFIMLIPALIAGKPFMQTISIYSSQMNNYPQMVLNTINIWVLLGNVRFENFNFAAILMAGIAVLSLLYFLYINKERISSVADYVSIAFVFALIIPMLLPRMHDRYFFLADVFSVIFIFFNKKRWYFAPIIIIGSFMTYSKFLLGINPYIPMEYASIVMIFVTLIAIKDLVERFDGRASQ